MLGRESMKVSVVESECCWVLKCCVKMVLPGGPRSEVTAMQDNHKQACEASMQRSEELVTAMQQRKEVSYCVVIVRRVWSMTRARARVHTHTHTHTHTLADCEVSAGHSSSAQR